tara:strand:+ start:432 stop:968 length:537 start_codon:yes stop_codon:yes gene_type:complete
MYFENYDNVELITVRYSTIDTRNMLNVNFKLKDDPNEFIESITITTEDLFYREFISKKVSVQEILDNTIKYHDDLEKFNQDLVDFIKYKNNGDVIIKEVEVKVESDPEDLELSLDRIKNATTEELFKLKLELFESESVQNIDNRDLRSKLRKSKNIIELFHVFYYIEQIYNEQNNSNG